MVSDLLTAWLKSSSLQFDSSYYIHWEVELSELWNIVLALYNPAINLILQGLREIILIKLQWLVYSCHFILAPGAVSLLLFLTASQMLFHFVFSHQISLSLSPPSSLSLSLSLSLSYFFINSLVFLSFHSSFWPTKNIACAFSLCFSIFWVCLSKYWVSRKGFE